MVADRDQDAARRRAFLRAGSTSLTYLDRDGVIVEINDAGLARLGLQRDQAIGRSVYELIPAMAEVLRARFARVFDSAEPLVTTDAVPLPSGTVYFETHLDPVFDEMGAVIAVLAQSRDVTREHAVSESLHRANQKLSVIFEQSPYLILVYSYGGIITYINRVGPGFTMDQVLGSDSHHFVMPEFHARYDEVLSQVFDRGEPAKFEFLDVNGSWWEATLVPVKHEGRVEAGISFSVDITERRRSQEERARVQEQMQSSQRLESLGVLAGGIAHDFNNLLLVITMNLDLAQQSIAGDHPARDHLADAMTASSNAADLCRQLLTYAGRGQIVIKRLDLSHLVSEMAQLLSVSVSKGSRLVRELAVDLPAIEADPTQLRQVVLNLITNASDSIGERQGVIAIRTRREQIKEATGEFWSQRLEPGEYVVLEVEDTGEGVDDATRSRMFEPFFTTKASGRGLGLSATLGILHRHKGAIAVHSTPGVGTRMRAAFPVVTSEAVRATAERETRAIAGRGLILVVDDEDGVRKAATAALARAGYEVVNARDGREGLEQYDRHRDRIRLVLLDLSMPVLSGQDTLLGLRERAPTLPVIIMSGYSESVVRGEHLTFLSKPFAVTALTELVGSLVNTDS